MARQFLKLTSDWDEDAKVAQLPDIAQLLFLKVLSRAKRQRPQGEFGSIEHLKALLPDRLHKHIATLLKAGLLGEDKGWIVVTNWSRYQVDPTAPERKARWMESRGTNNQRSGNGEVRTDTQRPDTQIQRDLTKKTSKTGMKTAFEIITGSEG